MTSAATVGRVRRARRAPGLGPARVAAWSLLVVVVLAVVGSAGVAAWWHHQGGRWFSVATPSMGESVPRGSLVVTEPARVADVDAGDVITFTAPGSGQTYTHRVVDRSPEGLSTQGDVNLVADAWTISDDQLVGRVAWAVPALGFVLRGLPMVMVGLIVTWLLTALLRRPHRQHWRMVGTSTSLAVTSWVMRPWVGLDQLVQTTPPDGESGVVMHIISTGLLPVRVFEVGGPAEATLRDGQVGVLHLTQADKGAYDVAAHLALGPVGWALLAAVVLSPLLWTLLLSLRPAPRLAASR